MRSRMDYCRCGHASADHLVSSICQEMIHYPNEDMPCFCETAVPSTEKLCPECEHPARNHMLIRKCIPGNRDLCGCVEKVSAEAATVQHRPPLVGQ